jgi:hypothetical protein
VTPLPGPLVAVVRAKTLLSRCQRVGCGAVASVHYAREGSRRIRICLECAREIDLLARGKGK